MHALWYEIVARYSRLMSGIAPSLAIICCNDVRQDRQSESVRHIIWYHKLSQKSQRRVSVNDKRLLIVSKRNNFQSMSNLVEAAKEGNVARVLELLPTSDINGTGEVGDLSSLTLFEFAY